MNRLIPSIFSLLAIPSVALAVETATAEERIEFFEKSVRPILAESCFKCHGPEKQKQGLRLDSREAFLKGSDDGAIITHDNLEASVIVSALRREGDNPMPPKEKLPPGQAELLVRWVKMGAPYPETLDAAKGPQPDPAKHWAFKPVCKPAVPQVQGKAWVKSPLDHFVLAKLESKGMAPSKPADRRTLLRRATFDLTGLPPNFAEIEAFEKDTADDAFENVIDRLLASPRYGERWGRYWLDVARYADTKGYVFEEERRYPYAYTYRDWVIRALNEDMPYDKFLIAQIAADQMPDADRRDLAAMGFLTLGRRFLNNEADIIDDRIDVVARGTMALTVACARCHNHKYDPIPTADYYSLYGVFASSTEPRDLPLLEAPGESAKEQAFQKELAARQAKVDEFRQQHQGGDEALKGDDRKKLRDLRKKVDAWQVESADAPPRAMVMNDLPKPVEPHVFKRGKASAPGEAVPRQFLQLVAGKERQPFQKGSGRLELAQAIASKDNPLTARVAVNRVWLHHFGAGLVRTPGDFGVRSDPPVQPELLDWLAARFVADGWSLKKLHRLIMLSATYQQGSDDRADYQRTDPDNQLLWRMNRQRLGFEAMRDALLAASGRLDLTVGGRAADVLSSRRTVYASIDRQNLPGVFRTFDFASPDAMTPQRFHTVGPQQALFMMNSPFVATQAQSLAALPEFSRLTNDGERLQFLYRRIFARAADSEEVRAGLQFVAGAVPESVEKAPPLWQYGYGSFDETAGSVAFTPLPHWTGAAWQGGPNLPDPKIGWVLLKSTGGHPGGPQFMAIRRWTAPRPAEIAISGTLSRKADVGDGIRARVVVRGQSVAGDWTIERAGEVATAVERVAVAAGDTVDFIVDCRATQSSDAFGWVPVLRALASDGTAWNAQNGFDGPPAPRLGAWEKFAQALLASNEFVFVD